MPIDVRKIIFSNRELRMILQKYCKEKGIQLPKSPLQNFEIIRPDDSNRVISENTPEGLKFILNFVSSNPNEPFRIHLTEDDVIQALIMACREAKIPLPRKANKHLQPQKDAIALSIGMNENIDFS